MVGWWCCGRQLKKLRCGCRGWVREQREVRVLEDAGQGKGGCNNIGASYWLLVTHSLKQVSLLVVVQLKGARKSLTTPKIILSKALIHSRLYTLCTIPILSTEYSYYPKASNSKHPFFSLPTLHFPSGKLQA